MERVWVTTWAIIRVERLEKLEDINKEQPLQHVAHRVTEDQSCGQMVPVQVSQEQNLWASALPAIVLGVVARILGTLCIHRACEEAKILREEKSDIRLIIA